MGALTLKPSAYQARPWELTGVELFNHYEGVGTLTFHLRGTRVVRVGQSGWMRDRIRFLYDGLKRQRLTRPHHRGSPVGWSLGVTLWVTLVAGRDPSFRVDPEGVHFYWLLRGYNLLRDPRGGPVGVTVDTPVGGDLYHGGFGLKPVESAELTLPGWLTPEEEGLLGGPTGGVSSFLFAGVTAQLWGTPPGGFTWGGFTTPGENLPREGNRALFQVSPLQRLLPGW
jgi:hypothetical protein